MLPLMGVGAIIFDEQNRILLMYRTEKCEFYPDCWFLPSGKVEKSEDSMVAVIREVREETSLEVKVIREVWNGINERGISEVAYLCERVNGIVRNVEGPERCRELEYFPLNNLPVNIHKKTLEIIRAYEKLLDK